MSCSCLLLNVLLSSFICFHVRCGSGLLWEYMLYLRFLWCFRLVEFSLYIICCDYWLSSIIGSFLFTASLGCCVRVAFLVVIFRFFFTLCSNGLYFPVVFGSLCTFCLVFFSVSVFFLLKNYHLFCFNYLAFSFWYVCLCYSFYFYLLLVLF